MLLTLFLPFMITDHVGLGIFNIGKGTICHIMEFVFPDSVTFTSANWEGTDEKIPKPAPGNTETITCIIARVYGRENEQFVDGLGPGLIAIYPKKLDMKLGCLKDNNIQGQARCTQLPITVVASMVVCFCFLITHRLILPED
jgi:hypothetical protein